jgi:hypothetical protein
MEKLSIIRTRSPCSAGQQEVPLWRGDHVAIKQLVEDFARYLYLPRIKEPTVLLNAIQDGLGLINWDQESFAYADSFDDGAKRYRGLRCGPQASISEGNQTGLLVKPEAARKQLTAEIPTAQVSGTTTVTPGVSDTKAKGTTETPQAIAEPKRFHASVTLDSTRVGRDAGRIADEVIAHLVGLVGSKVKVILEIEAEVLSGVPDNVVRIVTENCRTLKFVNHGFESE